MLRQDINAMIEYQTEIECLLIASREEKRYSVMPSQSALSFSVMPSSPEQNRFSLMVKSRQAASQRATMTLNWKDLVDIESDSEESSDEGLSPKNEYSAEKAPR